MFFIKYRNWEKVKENPNRVPDSYCIFIKCLLTYNKIKPARLDIRFF